MSEAMKYDIKNVDMLILPNKPPSSYPQWSEIGKRVEEFFEVPDPCTKLYHTTTPKQHFR
jgi:hypothetical protein